jgi:hypothetical protein
MANTRVIGIALIGALAVAPAFARADEGQRQRGGSDGRRERAQGWSRGESRQGGERAVPRGRESQPQGDQGRRREDEPRGRQPERSRDEGSRQYAVPRPSGGPRYEGPRYDNPQYGGGRYESQRQYQGRRYEPRAIQRPYYSRGGYGPRTIIVPRYIRPSIVTIAPYRPYVYRPRFGIGVYYGDGGSYPYGYTPRGYYDPLPGRVYGGLRITDAPREAQVFADGYYLGIVDDFDGMFQHANLEAGTHRIEIQAPGFESVAFDVMVQPGRTITFRAEMYPY